MYQNPASDNLLNRISCDKFLNSNWNFMCQGEVYEETLVKWSGKLLVDGNTYAVFKRDGTGDLMLIFNFPTINQCTRNIRFDNINDIICTSLGGTQQRLKTQRNVLACLPFRLGMADELYANCRGRSRRWWWWRRSADLEHAIEPRQQSYDQTHTMLYYYQGRDRLQALAYFGSRYDYYRYMYNDGGPICANILLVILSVLLIMLLLRRFL